MMMYTSKLSKLYLSIVMILLLVGASLPTAIDWQAFDDAYKETLEKHDRPMLVYFYADYCGYCRKLEKEAFKDSTVATQMNETFYLSKVDLKSMKKLEWDGQTISERQIAQMFKVRGVPTVAFIDTAGKLIAKVPGYMPKLQFKLLLAYIGDKWYRDISFQDYIKSEQLLEKDDD